MLGITYNILLKLTSSNQKAYVGILSHGKIQKLGASVSVSASKRHVLLGKHSILFATANSLLDKSNDITGMGISKS